MQPESNYAKLHLIVMAHILSSSSVVNLLFFTILQKKLQKLSSMYILGMLCWKGQWGAFLSIFRPMTFILDQNKRIAYSLIGTRFDGFQLQKEIFVKI